MVTRIVVFCCLLASSFDLPAQISDFGKVNFQKADSIAELYSGHSLQNLKFLTDKLTQPLNTDVEKFRAIYKWVCNNIDFDYSLYLINEHKRRKAREAKTEISLQWTHDFSKRVFENLLKKHRTVCTGYAYLVKEMACRAGLAAVIIDGYGRNAQSNIGGPGIANHSWNAIRLGGKWYLCDPTWSSGAYETGTGVYIRKFNAAYFLADPALFIHNHYPIDATWLLLKDKPRLEEFLNGPLAYSGALRYEILPRSPGTFTVTAKKGERICFQFSANTMAAEKMSLAIGGLKTRDVFKEELCQGEPPIYAVEHTFSTRGSHVIHVMADNDYLFTYNIKVK